MGLSLLAITLNWQLLLVILEVALGLGMVIFVHELGHFAVAKLCGVKCEKFYLGFDIYGLKLFHYQWGETEYGIGILPLGGYVKMLGQDDNPGKAAEERERSRLNPGEAEAASMAPEQLDPRSYMAKSVPQRMAIISAGVIMNLIFAVLIAAVAYGLGVQEVACGISEVLPGEAAWTANLQPGDQILAIGDSGDQQLRYRDLLTAVALCDLQKGIDFTIRRAGVAEPFRVNVKPDPDKNRMRPTIGVLPPRISSLSPEKAVYADTPAAATGEFHKGDKIVAVGGVPVATYPEVVAQLTAHADHPLSFTVERAAKDAKERGADGKADDKADDKDSHDAPPPERAEITVAPRPMRTLGLSMKMGPITAVQNGSPAEAAGIRVGDQLQAIDGKPPGDPLRLPDELRRRAGETVTLTIVRGGTSAGEEKKITLRERPWPEDSEQSGAPVSVPSLGITYKVMAVVDALDPQGPAAAAKFTKEEQGKAVDAAGLAVGDEIVSAEFIAPKKPDAQQKAAEDDDSEIVPLGVPEKPLALSDERPSWAYLMFILQHTPDGVEVKLTTKDGRTGTLSPVSATDWFYYDRGLVLTVETSTTKAHSVGEALSLGARETKDTVLQVYLFLRKIGSQVSLYSLGGPKSIAMAAGSAAYDGVAQLLIFLTMLSANLAVINFLPIPLLDGGHMVFLLLEGIFRRPVSERVIVAFHYLGFVFIISLMLFVLGLDFGVIPRPH